MPWAREEERWTHPWPHAALQANFRKLGALTLMIFGVVLTLAVAGIALAKLRGYRRVKNCRVRGSKDLLLVIHKSDRQSALIHRSRGSAPPAAL
jgi:hypothetical protein